MTDVHCAKWERLCDKQWEQLEPISDGLKFCHACQLAVHRVDTQEALEQMAAQGKCVAFVDEPLSWLVGRPAVVEYAYRQAKKERGGDDGS